MEPEKGKCRSCGAAILWVKTVAGKAMPLDAVPAEDGNIALMPAGAMVLPKETADLGQKIGARRYKSHFATCPNAAKHRKGK
jgi:hypothetical protein